MLETTASSSTVSPDAVSTPAALPWRVTMRRTPVFSRNSTPRLRASFSRAAGTARVPPIGYQTPPSVCIWAMEQSTAGEP